jgi:hypothetical protein
MKKNILSLIAGIILAFSVSLFTHNNSLQNLYFNLGFSRPAEEKAIEEILKLFNRHFATFFNSGGSTEFLDEFPSTNLIKRRIFQEINQWEKNNAVIVYDKDVFETKTIDFLDPVTAVAVTREVWFINVQDIDTRKYVSTLKANPIQVRYILKLVNESWLVIEYDVFDEYDDIPPFRKWRS